MVKVVFVEPDGTPHSLDVTHGLSLMEGAVRGDVPGIEAECGGACVCATCRVEITPAWFDKLGERTSIEEEMLADEFPETIRLSCQIKVTDELEGLVVNIPESQS